jgi:hypothetical protein
MSDTQFPEPDYDEFDMPQFPPLQTTRDFMRRPGDLAIYTYWPWRPLDGRLPPHCVAAHETPDGGQLVVGLSYYPTRRAYTSGEIALGYLRSRLATIDYALGLVKFNLDHLYHLGLTGSHEQIASYVRRLVLAIVDRDVALHHNHDEDQYLLDALCSPQEYVEDGAVIAEPDIREFLAALMVLYLFCARRWQEDEHPVADANTKDRLSWSVYFDEYERALRQKYHWE